jgi:ribosome-associated protein
MLKDIYQAACEKKAEDILILDIKDLSNFTDYLIILTANSDTQAKTICDYIQEKLKYQGIRPHHIEGYNKGNWILLDYGDIIVNIFLESTRRFYQLEELWHDGKVISL